MTELQQRIVDYVKKYDRCPTWKSVGTDYYEGTVAFDELFKLGVLGWEVRISPKGRKINHIVIK